MDRHFKKFFDDDPFFSGMPSFDMPLSLTDGRGGRGKDGGQQRSRSMDPFSDMFRGMEDMRNNMMKSFEMMNHDGNNDGHSFRSSTIMTYSNDGKSKPKYYQASSSVRTAPGQLKETRRTVRDSEKELEKMAIGHHMGQRGKIVERRRIRGEEEEEQNYLHMDESEGPAFDKEWQRRASDFMDIPPTMHDSRFANVAGLPSAPRRSSEDNMSRRSRNELGPSLEVQGKKASKNKRLQFK